MRALLALLASAPAVVLALASVWLTAGAARGDGLWPADDVTLSEAVATRNAAEASRLIGMGVDPNRAARVRPGVLLDHAILVTPLEAAVWAKDEHLLDVLLESGVLPPTSNMRVLRCLNEVEPDAGVRRRLQALSATPWPQCEGFTRPGARQP